MSNISLSRLNPRQFQLFHQMLASFTSSCNTWKPIIMNMWQKRLKLFSRFSCELSNDLTVRNVDDPDWDLAQCELILYVGLVTRESAHLYIDVLQCNLKWWWWWWWWWRWWWWQWSGRGGRWGRWGRGGRWRRWGRWGYRWDGIEPVDIVVRNRRYYVLRCLPGTSSLSSSSSSSKSESESSSSS